MYYSSGNYEAFARPKKPEGVDNKSAYIVGSGLAALTAACYLVRDGQMKGERVHILEKGPTAGGACDGWKFENIGYVMRGGREMDNHFEVMWDLFHSIPSIETEGVSVLDEYYWLNKADPNYSLCRATEKRGQDAHTDGKFDISDKGAMEIMKLFFTPNEDLQDKRITDFFDDEVFNSNFWLYWRTMFAFENWHSALAGSDTEVTPKVYTFQETKASYVRIHITQHSAMTDAGTGMAYSQIGEFAVYGLPEVEASASPTATPAESPDPTGSPDPTESPDPTGSPSRLSTALEQR